MSKGQYSDAEGIGIPSDTMALETNDSTSAVSVLRVSFRLSKGPKWVEYGVPAGLFSQANGYDRGCLSQVTFVLASRSGESPVLTLP